MRLGLVAQAVVPANGEAEAEGQQIQVLPGIPEMKSRRGLVLELGGRGCA